MSLLLYAISDHGRLPEAPLVGVDGAVVRLVAAESLVAAVTEHDRAPAAEVETLWTFDHVIEALMGEGAALPVRFGTLLDAVGDVERMLRIRRLELEHKLEGIRGAVELSVRGIWPDVVEPATVTPALTGTAYMRSRLEPQRRARDLAARVHAHLDDHARASRHRLLTRSSVPVSAAFLVEHGSEDDFLRRVRELDAQLQDAELVCTGPWPAYSFVGDAGDE
ncbi:MAG: GvpL/GvpF family gas vesicle protein [Solirubrobacteraceae bacterium]